MPNKDVATKYGVRRNTVLTWVKSKDKLIASLKRSEENAREARKYQSMVSFLKKSLGICESIGSNLQYLLQM